ncbi:hypothetical protein PVAND_009354 [Polypedilum vanderplanki]|uniref:trypsin n=1 Tax=Polypedilum vanderplanki TaxID=319348 RepID=A0A9J6CD96_POLVA|nr:hypothetical protein PVAND_009354 [Polypedilum vanderplanki]
MKIFLIFVSLIASIIAANVRSGGKIVGGIEVPIENVPYQVSVRYNNYHTCGGSIISSSFILTAQHCTSGRTAGYLTVRAGSNSSINGGEIFQVSKIIPHPNFNEYSLDYDFSLLKLTNAIVLDGITKDKVQLPTQDEILAKGIAMFVSGWGATLNPNQSTSILRGVTITSIDFDTCNLIYLRDGGLGASQICAGELAGGKDSCYGDSGGPMVSLAGTRKLYGVVSWGIDCALPGWPGVYARVSLVRNWIDENTKV